MDPANLRNVGICAHIDAGKTTLTERILQVSGRERRAGRVDDGTTVMDWMVEERERGITITAAATRVSWGGAELNLIDTPGHVDFTVEVERAARVLDGAVLVIDAIEGVQAQTETIWRQLDRYRVPCVGFVNKCDRAGSDVLAATETLSKRLGVLGVPVAYPFQDEEERFAGVVDLVRERALVFAADGSMEEEPIPASVADEAGVLRQELVECAAERDPEFLERFAAGGATVDDLDGALRRLTIARELVPVLCGAALRGVGAQPVLDAIVAWLPSPLEAPPPIPSVHDAEDGAPQRDLAPDPERPLVALAFKVMVTPHADLTFVRLYAGRIEAGAKVWNPRLARFERVAQVLRMHARDGEALQVAEAGDIVALTGLTRTGTGDTLSTREQPTVLESLRVPEPVLSLIVEPADGAERERLGDSLARLAREDPSFHAVEDSGTGQWLVEGMGELHLEVQLGRLRREFGLEPRVGQPRVAYREALVASARGESLVDRPVAGKDALAWLEVEAVPAGPGEEGAGGARSVRVEWGPGLAPDGAREPARGTAARHAEAIEAALVGEATSGPRFGLPLVELGVRVVGARGDAERDVEGAWVQAAVMALRAALRSAAEVGAVEVREPLMALVVDVPEEFSSSVIGDLNARNAVLGEVDSTPGQRRIRASAPLAKLVGYTTALRSQSQGRGACTMQPAGFGAVSEAELDQRGFV